MYGPADPRSRSSQLPLDDETLWLHGLHGLHSLELYLGCLSGYLGLSTGSTDGEMNSDQGGCTRPRIA